MLPSEELLGKFSKEILEKILQHDYTYLNEFIIFLQSNFKNDVNCVAQNQKCQYIFSNIHLQLIDIIVFKKHLPDYQSLLPQILFQTFYLSQPNNIENQYNNVGEFKWTLPKKIDEIDDDGIHMVNFVSVGKNLKLSSEKYDQYCLQIQIGAVKCLEFENKNKIIFSSIQNICDLCLRHSEVNLEAIKHLTECLSFLTKEQWKMSSNYIYKVIMAQMNHHLPPVHDQCMLLFKKCLDIEDPDYILSIVMTEMSWSLRIKFYMLTVIASKYGAKKILEKYDILSISMWKCLNEPYLLSPCIGLYKTFIKDLSEDDFSTLVMQPIIHYMTTSDNISELTKYNFVTYLLPEMKFEHTTSLFMLYEAMNDQSESDLYIQISVLRMIYNHDIVIENADKILDSSLKSGDAKIRSEAFTILCCSKISSKSLSLIYNFIVDNVNSDSLTLRLKLISGLENLLRKCKNLNSIVIQFLNELHAFVLTNLIPGSNYQRKFTSLKIYSIILKFNKNQNYTSKSCRNLLFTNLLDSDDIRKKCSEILVSYFTIDREDKMYLNNWMKIGLNLCYDPLFYKNESGSIIIYTVTTLVYKSGLQIDMFDIKNSSVSAYILNLAQEQVDRLKENFVTNVTNSTLYGMLDVISNLSFEKKTPEKNMLNKTDIEVLLNLIDDNLNLMLNTLDFRIDVEERTEAPSFAQMDNALSSLSKSNQDDVQVPTNQFLLNFIWINIKICCDVASKYAAMLANSDILDKQYQNVQIKRCADMVAGVLIRCRHKGAMEANCRSLGIIIKHWKESTLWCKSMLTNYVSCMKPEDEISRRSAGVRYLIHAIVTNNKNTVGDCIKLLFNLAKKNESISDDTIVDLPQARAQHLLTTIIANASISTDSLYYFMEDLIMLCVDKLNSPLWTVRNAALQFFSSLQMRLIGQNRLNNHCWLSHLPLEPLLYHFPRLMHRLQSLWSQTDWRLSSQARLIPFMSLLKSVKLQSWTLLSPEHQQFIKSLRCNMWSTGFAVEIYTVRNMAAQAYANTILTNEISTALNQISHEIIKHNKGINDEECKDSNHLHGLMLLYKYLKDVHLMEFNQEYQVFDILHENLPPLCKSIYITMNHKIIGPFPSNSTIGHIQVKHLMIQNDINQSSDLPGLIEKYMNTDNQTAISFLKCFQTCNKNSATILIDKLVYFLYIDDKDMFKEIMMNIDVIVNRRFGEDIRIEIESSYFTAILKKCKSYPEKDFIVMLPVLSWLCPSNIHSTLLPFVCKYVNCDLYDSFDRFRSSKSLYYFTDLKDNAIVWNTVVELLQDEDADVRVEVTRFVNQICFNHSSILNPYLCLKKMFEMKIICSIINPKIAFVCFWNLLSEIKLRTEFDEIINPFFNEQSNVYQEQSHVMKLAFEGLKLLILSNNEHIEYYKNVIIKCLEVLRNECEFKKTLIDENLMILDTYSSINLIKLYYKREILILLNLNNHLNMFVPILQFINTFSF